MRLPPLATVFCVSQMTGSRQVSGVSREAESGES